MSLPNQNYNAITMGNSWSVLHASKCPLVTAVLHKCKMIRLHTYIHTKGIEDEMEFYETSWQENHSNLE